MVGLWLESEFAHSWQQSNRAQKGCSGFALEQSNPHSGFRYAHYYSFTCLWFFTVQLVSWFLCLRFLLNVFHCSWEMTFTPAMFSVWVCVWSVCVSWFVCVCCLLICCRYFSYFSVVVVVVVCVILSMDKLIDDQWRAASLRQLPVMLQRDR